MTLEEALSKVGQGDVEAMVTIANYFNQQSIETNDSKVLFDQALPWYTQAANRGHEFSKKMAARIHFLHAYATRKALGLPYAKAGYEEETELAIQLIQSMKQPDTDLLQEIREDMAIFCCEMSVELEESAPHGKYINKTIENMRPYAESYKRKESLQALVMALSMFTAKQLHSMGFVKLFVKSAWECDPGHESNVLYKAFYAYIWSTIGAIYLNGVSPYPVDDTTAYHCYEKACTYSDQYSSTLTQFKKKLFGGGYVYKG